MKKLSISFILLFGFLALVPQNVKADVLVMYTVPETQKMSRDLLKSLLCFYKKKLNIHTNYEEQNLKLIEVPYYTYDPSLDYQPPNNPSYNYSTDANINGQDICDLFPNKREELEEDFPTSICNNGVCKEQKPSKNCIYTEDDSYNDMNKKDSKYTVRSFVSNCKEYIKVYNNTAPWIRESYGYDVTNVPPGSSLKFIPKTKEVQVISNKDESYKKNIPNKIKVLKAEEKKFNRDIPSK